MPRQELGTFQFPHETDDASNVEIEVEGSSAETVDLTRAKPKPVNDEIDVEIVDDTPVEDQGRTPSEPPKEVTDEELESYSDKVRNRIKHFSKGYHDERRAKEEALREREALENYAKKLMQENEKLKGDNAKSKTALIEAAKKQAERELKLARNAFKNAHERGDSQKLLAAQERLNKAQTRAEQVKNLKAPLQPQKNPVNRNVSQPNTPTPRQQAPRPKPQVDEKAQAWASENEWFGKDDEMTAFAYGLHNRLAKDGYDLKSDAYYDKINSRMREKFPEKFGGQSERSNEVTTSNNVAPATRTQAPKKVKLNKSEVAIAKRLGVSLQDYAAQKALEMRK